MADPTVTPPTTLDHVEHHLAAAHADIARAEAALARLRPAEARCNALRMLVEDFIAELRRDGRLIVADALATAYRDVTGGHAQRGFRKD